MVMRSGLSGWDLTVARSRSKGCGQFDNVRVGEIMFQDFGSGCAFCGHGFCARLAETDAMPFAGSLQNDVATLLGFGEVVAGNRIPSNPANQGEAGSFV